MRRRTGQLAVPIVEALRESLTAVLASAPPDWCIASTRVAIEAFRHFGVQATAVKASLMVFNPPMARWIQEHRRLPAGQEEIDALFSANPSFWSVGLGFPANPQPERKWPGHLVAMVDQKYLFDTSLDQAARGDKQIDLPRVLVSSLSPSFLKGGVISVEKADSLLFYRSNPKDVSFQSAPAWRDRRTLEPYIRLAVRRAEDLLGGRL